MEEGVLSSLFRHRDRWGRQGDRVDGAYYGFLVDAVVAFGSGVLVQFAGFALVVALAADVLGSIWSLQLGGGALAGELAVVVVVGWAAVVPGESAVVAAVWLVACSARLAMEFAWLVSVVEVESTSEELAVGFAYTSLRIVSWLTASKEGWATAVEGDVVGTGCTVEMVAEGKPRG